MSSVSLTHEIAPSQVPRAATAPSALRVNRPGDTYEQEAENVAEQVISGGVRKAAWSLSRIGIAPPLQRECSCGGTCDECEKEKTLQRDAAGPAPAKAPTLVSDVLRGPGHPMDSGTRGFMESRFGFDFGSVRIYNDGAAANSARALSANAYTVGEKVVFNSGKYAPSSKNGKRLLAHELAHVVQQSRGGPVPALGGDAALEADADRVAQRVDSPFALLRVGRSSGVGLARDPAAEGQLIEVKFPDGVKQLTPEQFAEYKQRALTRLRNTLKSVADAAAYGRKIQTDTLAEYQGGVESVWDAIKKPKSLIGIAADIKAGVTPPWIGMWGNATGEAQRGLEACDHGDLATAARMLQVADRDYKDSMATWNAYIRATIGGAEGVVSNLETVRDVSFAVALVAGAAVAAPVIAGAVAATGATGAVATTATALGTGAVVGTGGAALRGGSAATGSLIVHGKVDLKEVKHEAWKGFKEGAVTGLTAGLGTSMQAAAKGAKLAQPLVQSALKRCMTEAGVNLAGEVTTEALDAAVPPEGAKEEASPDGPKPLVGPKARAALTGCVSGVLGVPVAKLGRTGNKATELTVGAGVGYADARLAGQSNTEAVLAAGQSVLTSTAVAHGHAGSEHAKTMKLSTTHEGGAAATRTVEHAPAAQLAEHPAVTAKPEEHTAAAHPPEQKGKSPTEKIVEKQKAAGEHEGPPAVLKEEAKATEPTGNGHDAVVTEHGIGKCSPNPCTVIHVEYSKELKANPELKLQYDEILKLRKTKPREAAKRAAALIEILEMHKTGNFKTDEVFGEIGKELGLKKGKEHKGGIREAVADAKTAGFIKKDGSPGSIPLAVQPHGSAPTVRDELGVTGKKANSAHIGPTSALRKLSQYSRSEALTMLLPAPVHKAFDAHWKEWAKSQRRKGKTRATISDLHKVMVAAIDQTPKLSKETKGAMAWKLHLEFFGELGLHPDAKFELPYKNIPKDK